MAIINGNAGNNILNGKAEADTISGGAGNDTITGGLGNDLARGGIGNDTFIWRFGDGNDTLRGQDGFDTLVIEDPDLTTITRDAAHAIVFDLSGNVLDLDDIERIFIRALAGTDGIFIDNLAGTDLKQVVVDLAGTVGGIGGDGVVDGVVRDGGAGNDTINVALLSGTVSITGPSAAVTIRNADKDDILELNGLGRNDTINASKLPAGVIQLSLNGDAGNDTITGSAGNDELDGGDGNDVVAGGRGNDTVDLGAGNDLFAWRADGVDTVNGGDGIDTLLIAGSRGGDDFFIFPNGALLTPFVSLNGQSNVSMIADEIERISVRALAGADTILIQNLTGTDVSAIDVDLAATASGTRPDADADLVSVSTPTSDVVRVTSSGGRIIVTTPPVTVTIAHAGVNDQLAIGTGSGNALIDASSLAAGKISLSIFTDSGNDTIFGSAGNDSVTCRDGDDVVFLDSGNDAVNGGKGNDVAHMGAGNDRYTYDLLSSNGNDTVIGGGGTDTFDYRDNRFAPFGELFTIEAKAGRAIFSRAAGEVVSLTAVERLRVLVGGGGDTVNVNDLAGSGVKLVAIDLAASVGSLVADGAADSVTVHGTGGNDLITIGKIAGGLSITGLPAQVTVTHADNGGISDVLAVLGGEGNDTIDASAMPDVLNAVFNCENGNDRFIGGVASKEVNGGDGNDTLSGGKGNDDLFGDAGNDRLFGGAGRDELFGSSGNDILDGGIGDDSLSGGTGNDVMIGGRGNDEITTGAGVDRVRYTSVLDGHDVVLDFDGDPAGGQDVLDLDALFDSLGIVASKRAGLVRIDDLGGTVEISVNADGKAGFELSVATLTTADVITKGQDVFVGT
jgi:Ca2+-binding RTX toxin-like protein